MLSQKMKLLLRQLHTDAKTVAEYAGVTPAVISRVISGARSYQPESHTVMRIAEGAVRCAKETHRLETLCLLTDCRIFSEREIKAALLTWLFDASVQPEPVIETDSAIFSSKLRALMELANISNSRLGRELFIDSSYISRMRNGRVPQRNSGLMQRLSACLTEKIYEESKESRLAALLEMPEDCLDLQDASEAVFHWLYNQSASENVQAVRALIGHLETFSLQDEQELPDFSAVAQADILQEQNEKYVGAAGLQRAVIRFLGNAAAEGWTSLWLYSDQNMEWMGGAFRTKWLSLMRACIAHGIRIRIIHNVERSAVEMLSAINAWLPLYLSGLIEPYYCTRKNGERFAHTLFLAPEQAAVTGFCVNGAEAFASYHYLTAPEELSRISAGYELLLADSRPLVRMSNTFRNPPGKYSLHFQGNIQLLIGDSDVIVNKLTAPQTSFTFTHSMLRKAFQEYAAQLPT